ncbi:MAG: hypothetical protein KGH60_02530 [Candidatus Micrarchaeota archaeon]|nr:hypothetical protein [Candidatus Micrarchaeota archaeon]
MPDYKNKRNFVLTVSQSETPEVQLIRLRAQDGQPYSFDPGMFIMISGVDATGKEYMAKAFSIASEPEVNELELFVVKEHDGHTSHFTLTKPGDVYVVAGPSGQFKFVASEDKKVLYLAGGTGLAPFMSMVRHIKRINADTDAVMLYSIKYPTEIIKKDELNQIATQINLKTYITVTRPQEGDGWAGQTGHIDAEMIRKYAPDYMERTPYICGPLAFVKGCKDALIALGVPAARIKADVWG